MRIALVSRDEVFPLAGGGIGQFVTAVAGVLSEIAEVTIFTTSLLRDRYERLGAQAGWLSGVRVVFVQEPSVEEVGGWYHVMHAYSARVWAALRGVYGERGPDVVEFADYLGEGFVTVGALGGLDGFLDGSRVVVRLHTSSELADVLDGFCKRDVGSRVVHAMERACLVGADRLVWQGGDVWGSYERFYGSGALASGVRIGQPVLSLGGGVAGGVMGLSSRRLGLLYAGRFERRKGVVNLVRAVLGLSRDDFELTLVGSDTNTGSLGSSVRGQLEGLVAGDERVRFVEGVGREQLAGLIGAHDVVVVPSLWECWPYAALEALVLNRPLLATPVGGLVEMVVAGRSGWLAEGTGVGALAAAVERVLDARGEVEALAAAGSPAAVGRELVDEQGIRDGYEALARVPVLRPDRRRVGRRGSGMGLVSVVVPYFRAARFVSDTIASVLAQSYQRLEIVLVCDGSFGDEDWVVAQIAAQMPVVVVSQINQGLGAARNFGVSQSRGRYVFPLDADNMAEPEFIERCVKVLEACPEVAYVTSWSRYVDEHGTPVPGPVVGYQPLGNRSELVDQENVAGDAAAVIPRAIFDQGFAYSEELTSFEDWHFYRELHARSRYGRVIPERLLRYRVRADSMQAQVAAPHRSRLHGEITARLKENAITWTAPPTPIH